MQRYQRFLRQRYRLILHYVGLIGLISSLVLLLPLFALLAFPAEWPLAWGFLLPGGLSAFVSYGLGRRPLPVPLERLSLQEGAVIAVLGWLLAITLSTLPYLAWQQLTFTQACFESTSGWTTTGLSVVDVSQAPHLILLLRSLTQVFGGAGFAIIAVGAIARVSGAGMTAAEGRGEQLVPNVRQSAKLVLAMYSSYIAVGLVALRLAGMSWFDAINHALTALSTGGFSTRVDSIGSWNQPAIELVISGLMIGGSLNYLTAYLLVQRRFRAFWRNSELRLQLGLGSVGCLILFWGVTRSLYVPWEKALRVAWFETLTALSTTGFATVDYTPWNGLGWWLIIGLMIIGGGAGSTAGGIKVFRLMLLLRGLGWEINRRRLPASTVTAPYLWQGDRQQFLTWATISQTSLFVLTYWLILMVGTGILAAYGYPLQDSLFEFVSSLSTVGLSTGITSAAAPVGVLWTEMAGMVLGRLEFFTVIIGSLQLLHDGLALWSRE
ncbi:MAG: TrkH family potassium uptake protein [Leptolyngbya sp. SIOISBB]|nr:TrkH family potassium uptake protein [Leptolyngbya sp. SIOISBB]